MTAATTSRYATPPLLYDVPRFSDIRLSVPPQTLSGRHPHDGRWHATGCRRLRLRRLRFIAMQRAAQLSTNPRASREPHGSRLAACGLHFTASRRQKHRRWVALEFTGPGTMMSLAFTERVQPCIALHALYYSLPFFLFSFILSSTDISSVLVRYASRWAKRPPYFLSTLVSSSATCFDTASVAPRRGQRMIQTEKAPELIVRAPAIVS